MSVLITSNGNFYTECSVDFLQEIKKLTCPIFTDACFQRVKLWLIMQLYWLDINYSFWEIMHNLACSVVEKDFEQFHQLKFSQKIRVNSYYCLMRQSNGAASWQHLSRSILKKSPHRQIEYNRICTKVLLSK